MNGVQTELGVAEFLYNLQQPTKKLDTSLYETILTELKIGSHLLLNKYAKQIIEEARAQTSTSRFVGGTPKKTSKKKKRKTKQSSGDTDEEFYTDVAETEGDEEESVSDTREWLRFEEKRKKP